MFSFFKKKSKVNGIAERESSFLEKSDVKGNSVEITEDIDPDIYYKTMKATLKSLKEENSIVKQPSSIPEVFEKKNIEDYEDDLDYDEAEF